MSSAAPEDPGSHSESTGHDPGVPWDDGRVAPPPPPAEPRPLFAGRGFDAWIGDVEAVLGFTFAFFVTFFLAILIPVAVSQHMLFDRPRPPQWMWAVLVPAGLAAIWLQWRSLRTIGTGLGPLPHPRPVESALRQRRWPAPLRPLLAAWWLGQVASCVLGAELFAGGYGAVHPTATQRAVEGSLQAFVLFMSAYASTCSLLLAVAAVVPRRGALMAVWRMRVIIDLVLTAAVTLWYRPPWLQ